MGSSPLAWPRPDGQPIDNDVVVVAVADAGVDEHPLHVSGGWWPTAGVHYRSPKAWLPKVRVRFDELVDKLSQEILHKPLERRLLEACCKATGYQAQRDRSTRSTRSSSGACRGC